MFHCILVTTNVKEKTDMPHFVTGNIKHRPSEANIDLYNDSDRLDSNSNRNRRIRSGEEIVAASRMLFAAAMYDCRPIIMCML